MEVLVALVVIVVAASGFFYWLIVSNQRLHAKRYLEERDEAEKLKRANKAADDVLAQPLGTDDEWLANQRRMHHENNRGETQEG